MLRQSDDREELARDSQLASFTLKLLSVSSLHEKLASSSHVSLELASAITSWHLLSKRKGFANWIDSGGTAHKSTILSPARTAEDPRGGSWTP